MNSLLQKFLRLGLLLTALWSAAALRAHDAGLSVADLQLTPATLELTTSYALADVRRMLPPYSLPAAADATAESRQAAMVYLTPLAAHLWELRAGDRVLAPEKVTVEFIPGDNLSFHATYARPPETAGTARALHFGALLATHREVFKALDARGAVFAEAILSRENPTVQFSLPPPAGAGGAETTSSTGATAAAAATVATAGAHESSATTNTASAPRFAGFFKLGVEHIWTGYDHLLFLFALLVACRSFRAILIIISCFTLAHSLTLGAATLGLVNLPPSIVEPLIAASIVFVGVENLYLRGKEPKHRGWLTFGFGLIHGFGFASVLRDLGVGAHGSGIAVPLFSFNLGVELGQVCVAAVVLPVMLAVFRSEKMRLRGGVVLSSLVTVAGLYWLVERTLLS